MVLSCSAYGCKVRFVKGIRFHKFPANPLLQRAWCIAMRRKDFVPNQHKRLCSRHFTKDCYEECGWHRQIKSLKRDAVPTLFDFPDDMSAPRVCVSEGILRNSSNDGKSKLQRFRQIQPKREASPEKKKKKTTFISKIDNKISIKKEPETVSLVPQINTWNDCTIIKFPMDPTEAGVSPQTSTEMPAADNCTIMEFLMDPTEIVVSPQTSTEIPAADNSEVISVPVTTEIPQVYTIIPEETLKRAYAIVTNGSQPEPILKDCSAIPDNCSVYSAASDGSTDTASSISENTTEQHPKNHSKINESGAMDRPLEINENITRESLEVLTEERLKEHNAQINSGNSGKDEEEVLLALSAEKVKQFISSTTNQIYSQKNEIKFLRGNLRHLRRNIARCRKLVSGLSENKLISNEVANALKWSLS